MSATDRFKNRARPQVSTRTDEVAASLQQQPNLQQEQLPPSLPPQSKSGGQVEELQAELASLPKISSFHLRVEDPIKEAISAYARAEKVTPETLLQAFWEVSADNPELLKKTTEVARQHRARRDRGAKIKTLLSRLQKL